MSRIILALETSSRLASVAVTEGERVLASVDEPVDTQEENLLLLIDRVLGSAGASLADLDCIAVGKGPGSFTGLRIGFATAKGLCFARNLPLRTVSSLAALALDQLGAIDVSQQPLLVPAIDARRGELFLGFFAARGDTVVELGEPCVAAPDDVAGQIEQARNRFGCARAVVFGDGTAVYPDCFGAGSLVVTTGRQTPSAASVGKLAPHTEVVELATAEPTYIRPSAAEVRFPHGNPGGPFTRE